MTDCIFCKIVTGEIPSTRIYEDDRFLGFMDINPLTRGHSLLIPKAHFATVFDMPDDILSSLIITARGLADGIVKGLGAGGINLIQSNGRAANQIIDHYHLHLLPRYAPDELPAMAWDLKAGDMNDIAAAAEEIKRKL